MPSASLPRVALDTNLVLSALVFGGSTPGKLRRGWQAGQFQPLASRTTAAELIRVLSYPKFQLDAEQQEQLLADYLPYCTVISVPDNISGIPLCRDSFDQPFLELAVAGNADYLVTGDQDLLILAGTLTGEIITATDFLEHLHAPNLHD